MNTVSNAEGKTKGVVFTCDNNSFAGYQIDRSMTYAKLCQSLGMVQAVAGKAADFGIMDIYGWQNSFLWVQHMSSYFLSR